MSGNYLAGAVWPPIMQHFIDTRRAGAQTYIGVGVFCLATHAAARAGAAPAAAAAARQRRRRRRAHGADRARGRSACRPAPLQALLCVAGVSLLRRDVDAAGAHRRVLRRPGLRRGARRRDAVADARLRRRQPAASRAGSPTASAACARCCSARCCRASRCCCSCRSTASCRSTSCRRCSACSRAASCRRTRSSCASTSRRSEAGARVGTVLMATLFGMALGGWMSGAVFDLTGSYRAAFLNGIALEPAERRASCCSCSIARAACVRRNAACSARPDRSEP